MIRDNETENVMFYHLNPVHLNAHSPDFEYSSNSKIPTPNNTHASTQCREINT